jgi:hypothetical protein
VAGAFAPRSGEIVGRGHRHSGGVGHHRGEALERDRRARIMVRSRSLKRGDGHTGSQWMVALLEGMRAAWEFTDNSVHVTRFSQSDQRRDIS